MRCCEHEDDLVLIRERVRQVHAFLAELDRVLVAGEAGEELAPEEVERARAHVAQWQADALQARVRQLEAVAANDAEKYQALRKERDELVAQVDDLQRALQTAKHQREEERARATRAEREAALARAEGRQP